MRVPFLHKGKKKNFFSAPGEKEKHQHFPVIVEEKRGLPRKKRKGLSLKKNLESFQGTVGAISREKGGGRLHFNRKKDEICLRGLCEVTRLCEERERGPPLNSRGKEKGGVHEFK